MSNAYIEGLYEVAINGRPYRTVQELHRRKFLDVIRQQADTSREPSEASLNPEGMWRRAQDDWVLGSGQTFYDDDESVRRRFRQSTGIDPWTKSELTCLPGINRVDSLNTPTGLGKSVLADFYYWVIYQQTKLARWNGASWTETTAVPHPIQDIATDGINIYLAVANAGRTDGGIYVLEQGDLTPVLINNLIPDRIAYVRGRLMVSAAHSLYNITDITDPTPPPEMTAPAINSEFRWTSFGDGQSYIYVAGRGAEVSYIYRISLREDGTALTAPVVATQLPDGETVNIIQSYLQVIVLGTSKGVRLAVPQGGSLTYGPLISDVGEVTAIEVQDRFAWIGNTDGDLWRLDLSRFVENLELTPAYASDLVSNAGREVKGIHTWNDEVLFTVKDIAVYEATPNVPVTGTFYSGHISFGMTDLKNFVQLEVHCKTFVGAESVDIEFILDDETSFTVGTLSGSTSKAIFNLGNLSGTTGEVKLVLNPDGANAPVVERFVVRALPKPSRTEQIQVAIDLRESLSTMAGAANESDVWAEFSLLQSLVTTGDIVVYQEFENEYYAQVDNVQWGPDLDVDSGNETWEGVCLVTLKLYSLLNPEVIADPTGIYISQLESEQQGGGGGGGGGASGVHPTFLVAAYNARQEVKDAADYVCTGADDDVQIQAAMDAIGSNDIGQDGNWGTHGRVLLSEGNFHFGDAIYVPNGCHLQGSGKGITIIQPNGPGDGPPVYIYDDGFNAGGPLSMILSDFSIDGQNEGALTVDGIFIINDAANYMLIENIAIYSIPDTGLWIDSSFTADHSATVRNIDIFDTGDWGFYCGRNNTHVSDMRLFRTWGINHQADLCKYQNIHIHDSKFSFQTDAAYNQYEGISIWNDETPVGYRGAFEANEYLSHFSDIMVSGSDVFGFLSDSFRTTYQGMEIELCDRGGFEISDFNSVVDGVFVTSTNWYGISTFGGYCVISNCYTEDTCKDFPEASAGHEGGFSLHGRDMLLVGCMAYDSNRHGIYLWGSGHNVKSCQVHGVSMDGNSLYDGIHWANGGYGAIVGNFINGLLDGFNLMRDGVRTEVGITDAYVRSNMVRNANGLAYNLQGTNNDSTSDNFG